MMRTMFFNRRSVLVGLGVLAAATARSQITIPNAELKILQEDPSTHRVSSRDIVLGNGRKFRLFLAVPKVAPPPEGHPMLYMLDGNGAFDALTPALLQKCSNFVLAGIGYDTPLRFEVNQRSLDYTPPVSEHGPVPDPDRPERWIGGADRFFAMLTGEIREQAENGLLINDNRRYLWGHSYGGLFALYALFTDPAAFAGYAPISPSVYWHDGILKGFEKRARLLQDRRLKIFLALGDREQRSVPNAPPPQGPAPQTMALIERLKQRPELDVEARVLAGLGHGATAAASLPLVFDWIGRG